MKNSAPCFCCSKSVAIDSPLRIGESIPAVFGATVWRCRGNFGSTIYDPTPQEGNQFLELYICDDCVIKNAERVSLVQLTEPRRPEVKVQSEEPFSNEMSRRSSR